MVNWMFCNNCNNYKRCIIEKTFPKVKENCECWTPMLCRCGGSLSTIREHNGNKYRHCYACHFEFPVNKNNYDKY